MLVLTQLFTDIHSKDVHTIAHNLAETALPPSSVIVAPFTNAPARLLKNKQDPATSCGVPIRPRGTPALIVSPNDSKVAAIILLSKGPQAKVFELQTESVPNTSKRSKAQQIYLRNVSLAQVVGEHPAQVVQTGLAGTVCECLERGNTESINATDIDNARRVLRCSRLL